MQNVLTSIKDVTDWIDDNASYIWTLYGADRKTLLSRNESEKDPIKSKNWVTNELKRRSLYGGSYWLYINEQKGNGGFWSEIMLPAQNGSNGVAGINGGGMMPYVGDIQTIVAQERKMWELEKKVEELENGQAHHSGFLERQAESLLNHPDVDPNIVLMSIGGLASRFVNILELAMGVNGGEGAQQTPPQYNYQRKPKEPQPTDPVNGAAQPQHTDPSKGDTEEVQTAEELYDGDALAEVCDELAVIYPSVPPEELLLRMKELLKNDKAIQGIVKKKLQIQ